MTSREPRLTVAEFNGVPGAKLNHFKFHIGDYAAATGHLTFSEDAAYMRLIRIYYGSEKPIPLDRRGTYRLVRAQSKQERDAVDVVLHEFFEEREDGWHQKRCDEELSCYHDRAEINRALGKRGGRPRKTETVSEKNPIGLSLETETVSEKNPSHKPLTNNHKPEEAKAGSKAKIAPDGELFAGASEQVITDFKALRSRLRAPITITAMNGIKREATKAGLSLNDALAMCCERSWRGFKAEWINGHGIQRVTAEDVQSPAASRRLA